MEERHRDLIKANADASELDLPPIVVDEQHPLALMYTDEFGTIAFFKDHNGQMWTYDEELNSLSPTKAADISFDPELAGKPTVDEIEGKTFTNLLEAALYIKWINWKTRLDNLESLMKKNEMPVEDSEEAQTEKELIIEFLKKYSELMAEAEVTVRAKLRTECESAFRKIEAHRDSY